MECCFIIEDELCGGEADKYMNVPLCETHQEKLRSFSNHVANSRAALAAKYHPLDSFPGFCYIVLLPSGLVKIGYSNTEKLLKKRMNDLRSQHGPLVVLATLQGGFVAEAVLHRRFEAYRVPGRGELFLYSAELAEYINEVQRGW